jgi:hypothetical protein
LQDVITAIRGGGRSFDGKLLLEEDTTLTEKKLGELEKAIEAVPGVKSAGAPDEKGRRVIALDVKKRTTLADILKAGRSVGVELRTPAKEKGPGG